MRIIHHTHISQIPSLWPKYGKGSFTTLLLILVFLGIFLPINQPHSQISSDILMDGIEPSKSIPLNTAADPTAFISVWDTSKSSYDSSVNTQIRLPLQSSGTYDFLVDWGDETSNSITNTNYTDAIHTYTTAGVYTISITGIINGWSFDNYIMERYKIMEIQQWGSLQLGNSENYFNGCYNLKLTASDSLNLTGTTTLYRAFSHCLNLRSSGNMNNWNVSHVTNMSRMFMDAKDFNQPLGAWDVSNVTDMKGMFWLANSFNQPIGEWNVSSVTDMKTMFSRTISFNQSIENWDVSSVTDMAGMFHGAEEFNQPLEDWDVSSVTDMSWMFYNATMFNQPLGDWNVSKVNDMSDMLSGVTLSTENYDHLLLGWSQLHLQKEVSFNAGYSTYSKEGQAAKQLIIDSYNWNIQDYGEKSEVISSFPIGIIGIFGILAIRKIIKNAKPQQIRHYEFKI